MINFGFIRLLIVSVVWLAATCNGLATPIKTRLSAGLGSSGAAPTKAKLSVGLDFGTSGVRRCIIDQEDLSVVDQVGDISDDLK